MILNYTSLIRNLNSIDAKTDNSFNALDQNKHLNINMSNVPAFKEFNFKETTTYSKNFSFVRNL